MKFFIKIIYFIISTCIAQNSIGQWDALTSPLKVNDLTQIHGETYAATGGGLFNINQDNQYTTFTTIDGLVGIDLSSITYDHNEHLWLGGNTPIGFLQIYDPIYPVAPVTIAFFI